MSWKSARGLLVSVVLFGNAGCHVTPFSLSQKAVLDVNGRQLTAQQFAQELAYRLKDQDALSAKDPKVVATAKSHLCEDFIVQALTEDWAKSHGVLVKAEDLDQQIKNVQKSYPDDLSFEQALAEEGTTFKAWRERLQKSLLQTLVMRKISEQQSPPTEAEMQSYYAEHHAEFSVRESAHIRQILVATESDSKIIEDELKRGKKLPELAKRYSISPEGPQGGDVGWLEKGMSEVFEPAFRMKIGQRSLVVKSTFGYHIFELVARKPARTRAFAEAKDEIQRILMEKRQQSLYLAWLEEQTRKARVYKDQDFIDGLKVETKVQ